MDGPALEEDYKPVCGPEDGGPADEGQDDPDVGRPGRNAEKENPDGDFQQAAAGDVEELAEIPVL